MSESDRAFAGSIPAIYERLLVPLIFEPYAIDLAARLRERAPLRVLELAAGTGVVTRALATTLPTECRIVATDLNPAMLVEAQRHPVARMVDWQVADAMTLPFEDGGFDAVVCQFGAMFFPDRAKAYAEARRVLVRGGLFLFNVWDEISQNEFADVVTSSLAELFPAQPPRFLARTPHGYHDPKAIRHDLAQGGFIAPPRIDVLAARSRAASAGDPAVAYCQGTPLRSEIEAFGPDALASATETATQAVRARFGAGPVDGKIQALVIAVEA